MNEFDIVCSAGSCSAELKKNVGSWKQLEGCSRILVGIDSGETPPSAEIGGVPLLWYGKLGACGLRNRLVSKSTAASILFLDDDSYVDRGDVAAAAGALQKEHSVGCLSFSIFNRTRGKMQVPERERSMQVRTFVACGALAKRNALQDIGGFPSEWGFYGEESYVSARMFKRNFKTVYYPAVRIIHDQRQALAFSPEKARRQGSNKIRWDIAFSPLEILPAKLAKSLLSLAMHSRQVRRPELLVGALRSIVERAAWQGRSSEYVFSRQEFRRWCEMPAV